VSAAIENAQAEFVSILGPAQVVTDAAACAALSVDGKAPGCIVYPSTPEQVAAVLRAAAEHDLGVIPCRNATKLAVGNPPRRYDVALSLKDMNRVWHYEPADLTITAEPGMKFGDFQHFVGRQGLWLPLDPPGGARASLGGIVATNAAGPLRLVYGAPRDIVLGMKIATVAGKVIKAGGRVVKNVTGYDIGKLLIGSFGTLGVIVEASFKLFPLPPERATFAIKSGTLGIARDLRRRILRLAVTPARLVLLDAAAVRLASEVKSPSNESKEPELWAEIHGSPRVIERARRDLEGLAKGAGAAASPVETERAENLWARATDLQSWVPGITPDAVILKATLPDSASEELISRGEQEAVSEKAGLAVFAQLGVGIVRFCIISELASPAMAELIGRLRAATEALGGALIVERCPVSVKESMDVWADPGSDSALTRKMKETWDPKGTLAPGRFLGRL
jgi:glycolate oxidase FAD binding subunit